MSGMLLDIGLVVAGLALAEAQMDKRGRMLLPHGTHLTESVVAFLVHSGVSMLSVKCGDAIDGDEARDVIDSVCVKDHPGSV